MSRNSGGNIECVVSCEFNNCESYTACFFMMLSHQDEPFDQPQALLIFHLLQLQLYMLSTEHFPIFFSLVLCAFLQTEARRHHEESLPFFAPSMSAVHHHEITWENPPSTPQGGPAMRTGSQIRRERTLQGCKWEAPVCSLSSQIRMQRAGAAHRLRAILLTAEEIQLSQFIDRIQFLEVSPLGFLIYLSIFFFFFYYYYYLCRRITETNIKPNASRYARWSAAGIKLVEPFKRMTVEIFQGEGGGRLRRIRAALWGFTVKLKRIEG